MKILETIINIICSIGKIYMSAMALLPFIIIISLLCAIFSPADNYSPHVKGGTDGACWCGCETK